MRLINYFKSCDTVKVIPEREGTTAGIEETRNEKKRDIYRKKWNTYSTGIEAESLDIRENTSINLPIALLKSLSYVIKWI